MWRKLCAACQRRGVGIKDEGIQLIFLGQPHFLIPSPSPARQLMSSDLRILPPDDSGPSLLGALYSMFTGGWQGMMDSVVNRDPKFPPLEVLPCANVNVEKHAACEKPGKLACSSCKLVSYCSKVWNRCRCIVKC